MKYTYLVTFLFIIIFGVGLEVLFSEKYFKHRLVHFKFSRYLFLLSIPFVGVFVFTYILGFSIIKWFIIFALVGTILEYCIGYSYYKVVGKNLWTYNKYSINGHTSYLAIPLWGLGGVLLYLMSMVID